MQRNATAVDGAWRVEISDGIIVSQLSQGRGENGMLPEGRAGSNIAADGVAVGIGSDHPCPASLRSPVCPPDVIGPGRVEEAVDRRHRAFHRLISARDLGGVGSKQH